jgi:N-acetylglutamate synthase-like GNAT family acetyltransferase
MASETFSLRPAIEGDDAQIRALIHAARNNPTGLDWRRFVVAVGPGGQVIGCGQVKSHRDGSQELASIAVAPAWRGNGTARAIIERLLAENTRTLFLTCRASLGGFYEKFGFRILQEGEMLPYFRRARRLIQALGSLHLVAEDLLVMKRD